MWSCIHTRSVVAYRLWRRVLILWVILGHCSWGLHCLANYARSHSAAETGLRVWWCCSPQKLVIVKKTSASNSATGPTAPGAAPVSIEQNKAALGIRIVCFWIFCS